MYLRTSERSRNRALLALLVILLLLCIILELAHRISPRVQTVTPQLAAGIRIDAENSRTSPRLATAQDESDTSNPQASTNRESEFIPRPPTLARAPGASV